MSLLWEKTERGEKRTVPIPRTAVKQCFQCLCVCVGGGVCLFVCVCRSVVGGGVAVQT